MSQDVLQNAVCSLGAGIWGFFLKIPPLNDIQCAFLPREERFTKKSDEAGEIPSDMDLGQARPPSAAGSEVPPAPPPSPTEDSKVSFLST